MKRLLFHQMKNEFWLQWRNNVSFLGKILENVDLPILIGADQIRRHAAAKLIQATWRRFQFNKTSIEDADHYGYRAS